VLPFARFPGADPVLGPEMRSTGEVMASAADLPTAFAKAERAAGRRLPTKGTAFLSVRDADKPACVPVAAALAGLGFRLLATGGTAETLTAAGLQVELVAKVGEENGGATILDLVRRGRCDLVINTPQGSGARRARPRGARHPLPLAARPRGRHGQGRDAPRALEAARLRLRRGRHGDAAPAAGKSEAPALPPPRGRADPEPDGLQQRRHGGR